MSGDPFHRPGHDERLRRVVSEQSEPQGLQRNVTDCPLWTDLPNPYRHLGFNPAPGSPDSVRGLRAKLGRCAEVLEETHGTVTRLMDGASWQGDAAVAFREQLENGPLPLNLRNAARSIRKAARQLDRWEADLSDFQRRASRLDARAREARVALATAESRTADAGPDAAMRRLDAAVDDARAELDRILTQARRLAEEHETEARHRAAEIRNATEKLAPHEPGFFEKAAEWLKENLPDILGIAAGVVALVTLTLVTGGTAAAVLLLAAAAMSAGALVLRLADPVVWESLKDGFTKGELDTDFWSNFVDVGADALGAIPGLGAVGKGAGQAVRTMRSADDVLPLGQKLATLGTHTVSEARTIAGLENPVLTRMVHAVGGPPSLVNHIQVGAASVSVGAGGIGLLGTAGVDSLDSDAVDGAGAVVDGAQIAGINSGEVIAISRRVFS